jgi:hypothetical protein
MIDTKDAFNLNSGQEPNIDAMDNLVADYIPESLIKLINNILEGDHKKVVFNGTVPDLYVNKDLQNQTTLSGPKAELDTLEYNGETIYKILGKHNHQVVFSRNDDNDIVNINYRDWHFSKVRPELDAEKYKKMQSTENQSFQLSINLKNNSAVMIFQNPEEQSKFGGRFLEACFNTIFRICYHEPTREMLNPSITIIDSLNQKNKLSSPQQLANFGNTL